MRLQWHATSPFILMLVTALFAVNVHASIIQGEGFSAGGIMKRDGMHSHHNSHAAPLLELNETEVTLYHSPTPPSYYTIDWEGAGEGARHPGLIVTHVILMCLAFFVALPIGEYLLEDEFYESDAVFDQVSR